jgi:ribosome-associated protein
MEERERAERAIAAARETKAEDILLFDMENRSPITDFVLICSGRSQAHVRGICERIEDALRKAGYRPSSLEGLQEGSWVLMDYDVLLVHVFHPDTRAYYDLEGLLQGFPSERIAGEGPEPSPDDDRADSAA